MSCHKCGTEESNLKPLDSTLWCSTAGDSECFLCLTLMTRWTTPFLISLLSSKFAISLISIYKHYSIDIADPSSMQDACYMNFVIDLIHCGVSVAQWKSIGAWHLKSEVQFLMGTQNVLFVPHLWQDKKHLSLFL